MSLEQLFDQFIGGGQNQSSNTQKGQGLSGLADKIPGGAMGGLAAGGVLGLLVGNKKVRKSVGKMAGGAVQIGGAALLGAVAYNAYQNWQSGKQVESASPASAPTSRPPQPAIASQDIEASRFDVVEAKAKDGNPLQITLIKAMIAAANSDGHIDRDEQKSIFDAVNKMALESEDKALVFDNLQNPPSIKEIAMLSAGLEQATEIYLVSRMAIDPDHPAEKAYLDDLAMYLSIPDDLRAHLEHQVETALA